MERVRLVKRAVFMYPFIKWVTIERPLCARHRARGCRYSEWKAIQAYPYGKVKEVVRTTAGGPDPPEGVRESLHPTPRKAHLCRKIKDEEELAGEGGGDVGCGCSRQKDNHVQNQLTWILVTSLTLTALRSLWASVSPFEKWRYWIRTKNYLKLWTLLGGVCVMTE